MSSAATLDALTSTLRQVEPTLAGLRELLDGQRRAVASGDLQALLATCADQEALAARLAHLEQRRQTQQRELETALGVEGLVAIGEAAIQEPAERAEYLLLVGTVRGRVIDLRQEHALVAALLNSASATAGRARAFLARLSGAEPSYQAPPGATAAHSPLGAARQPDGRP